MREGTRATSRRLRRGMPLPAHFHVFWRALDDLLARVRPVWWGAVVTDPRFPAIWDANYARVDAPGQDLHAMDVEIELVPALAEVGADVMHVVSFDPSSTTDLLAELSTRGHRIGWDLLMDLDGDPPTEDGVRTEEVALDDELWSRIAESLTLFGVTSEVAPQLVRLEREVLGPGGKRWFGVRDERQTVVSMASLILLEGVGYVDHVVTFPAWRGRGLASAITTRICREARDAGAAHVSLLADPDATSTVAMYERLGFRGSGSLASTRGPVPQPGDVSK